MRSLPERHFRRCDRRSSREGLPSGRYGRRATERNVHVDGARLSAIKARRQAGAGDGARSVHVFYALQVRVTRFRYDAANSQ